MQPYEVFFALFALFGIAVVAPVWTYYVSNYLTGQPVMQFLSTLVLPVTALLLVASWLQPG